jgi:hypothetical protein
LTLLRNRTDTHKTVERFYCQGFDSVWTGRVNESPARGDRTITYDGGAMAAGFVFADLTNYGAGMEVWFGSAAGLKDRGVRRLRSMGAAAVAGNMIIEWHDDMDLSDDDFITIKHVYPPWPKYSWFTTAGPAFRKDGPDGTLYAASGDANDTPAPHVIMGRHYANEMPAAGTIAIQCDATNSIDVAGGGGAAGYAWALTPSGGGAFDNAAIGTPVLTIAAAGRYWIHCTATIDGLSTTGHRAVIVGGGITEFSRGPITHRYDSTDIECQLTITSPDEDDADAIRPQVEWDDFQDHALVIITAADYYGTTQKTISFRDDGVYTDRQHIVFAGYLILENDDLVQDGTGQVQLSAVSLVDMFLYSQSLTGVTNATQWYEMNQAFMTVAGNLLYLLRWHSTLLDIADWWLPWSDTVKRSANEEFGEGDMLERGRALARARIMAITANPQGEIFVETDLNLRTAAERAAETTTLTLVDRDVAGSKRARLRRRGDLVRALTDGGYSTGVMGSFQPFFSASANVATATARPAIMHQDRLMLPSQTESNRLAARLGAVANRRYVEVNLDFAGNYREVFSPADQQWTNLGNVFAGSLQANIRGDTGLVSALCVPREVTHSHDNAAGTTSVSATFDVEAPVELDGRTITPPVVPSEDPNDDSWDMPEPPGWPPVPPDEAIPGPAFALDADLGVYYTPGGYAWEQRNGGLTPTGGLDLIWDPWWTINQASSNPEDAVLYWTGDGFLRRSQDGATTWEELVPLLDDPPDIWGDLGGVTASGVTYKQIHGDIHANGTFHVVVETLDITATLWRGWLLSTTDHWMTHTWTAIDPSIAPAYPEILVNGAFDLDLSGWYGAVLTVWEAGTARQNKSGFTYAQIDQDVALTAGTTYTYGGTFTRNAGFNQGAHIQIYQGAVLRDSIAWIAGESGAKTDTYTPIATDTYTVRLYSGVEAGLPNGTANGWWDDVSISRSGSATEARPIAFDLDVETGETLYIAVGVDDALQMWVYDVADPALPAFTRVYNNLGEATPAEVIAKTYYAVPRCAYLPGTANFGNYVYIFGIFSTGAHIVYSTDAGASGASIGDGTWAAARVTGFHQDGQTLYAFLDTPRLWQSLDNGGAWTNVSDPGIVPEFEGVSFHASGRVLIANSLAAGAVRAAWSDSPYTTWNDATGSAPDDLPDAGAGSAGLPVIVWI